MATPGESVSSIQGTEKGRYDEERAEITSSSLQQDGGTDKQSLKFNKVTIGFFFIGVLIGLPAMITTTSANEMFAGITGVYEVCASLTAAVTSFSTPLFSRFISYNTCTIMCIVASALSYVVCTLPHPLQDESGTYGGPVVGTMFAGFVYAFGTNIYMAVAAFFPKEAVLGLSIGSGFSVILGPAVYIGIMAGFEQDWRRTFLVLLPSVIGMPVVWWGLIDPSCREAAERSRLASITKTISTASSESNVDNPDQGVVTSALTLTMSHTGATQITNVDGAGFGPDRSRLGFLFKTIFPKYVVPLMMCTSSATICMMGTSPTLQALNRFRSAPEGDLQFHLVFLSYGSAQFIFSTLAALRPIPLVWIWTGIQITLMALGIIQIFHPFLTYYGVWVAVMFFVGGCVGGGVTNTNYKIAEDFRRSGDSDEVRSFAMSYAGLGNFGGDALGGALGVMVQQLATKGLKPGR